MSATPFYKQINRYDITTGRLLGVGQLGIDTKPEAGQSHWEGRRDLASEYVDIKTMSILTKLPLGATLSADSITLGQSVTLAPLPIPCTVMVSGAPDPVVVEDGALEITPQSIGESYRVLVDEVEYLRETWFFEVLENEN